MATNIIPFPKRGRCAREFADDAVPVCHICTAEAVALAEFRRALAGRYQVWLCAACIEDADAATSS
jgi:hypothetical protein